MLRRQRCTLESIPLLMGMSLLVLTGIFSLHFSGRYNAERSLGHGGDLKGKFWGSPHDYWQWITKYEVP